MSTQPKDVRLKSRFKVGDIVRWNALALHGDERNGWKIEYMEESEGLSPIWAVTKNKELRSAVEMDMEPDPTRLPTFGSTFYDRNPAAVPWRGRLVEMRSQETLLRGAFFTIKQVRAWRGRALWTLVGAITGHGSGYSQQICEELGWDYAMKITPTARLPEKAS